MTEQEPTSALGAIRTHYLALLAIGVNAVKTPEDQALYDAAFKHAILMGWIGVKND